MNKLVRARKTPVGGPPSPNLPPEKTSVMSQTMVEAIKSIEKSQGLYSTIFPRSQTEQYWAARALSAETLLTARTEHHFEMRDLTRYQEERRTSEIAVLTKAHEERLVKMENLILILTGALVLISAALLFVYVTSAPNNPRHDLRSRSLTHFTIPILSPFASVVENESSVVGTKTIAAVSVILATLVYLMFRYWIAQPVSRHR
ncbi:hypothetical protein E1B28_012378 [Marasmius oreades]|uniref:Uncharacterized protein n=1 Tax=Marasmius oreades TaxID=181124 RepID=A0A9P7RRK8_9AGAR|nr:uncharacterized protein E1B28_012378 [Marasmius oreades]KAG7088377.1 hypothetical protein E1B28_012378 [Marasmius oreades]